VNKNIFLAGILVCILMLANSTSQASSLNTLYHGQMPVADQSRSSRDKAVSKILEQVLIKVSGQSKIALHPQIKRSLKAALSFATEFSVDIISGNLTLTVEFNESLIDELLKSNKITIWDVRRPSVMLWMVYEDSNGRQLLSTQSTDELVRTVKNAAAKRGMPLLLPIWDLDDQLTVSTTDIWGQFEDKVSNANARYQSDYMILAKVMSHGISQQVSWSVFKTTTDLDIFGQAPSVLAMTGNDETPNINEAIEQIIDQSTDYFASQYSVDTSEDDGDLFLSVNNVNSLSQYVKITDYLSSIKAVNEVVLVNSKSNDYRFKINLLGNRKSFLDIISLDKRLARIVNYDASLVIFQWRD